MITVQRPSATGETQSIYLLDNGLKEHELQVKFDAKDYGAVVDADQARYSTMKNGKGEDAIYRSHWREPLLVFPGSSPKVDVSNLEMAVSSSFHVQAVRKGVVSDITPATVVGLIQTADHKFVFGIRGGQTSTTGQANTVPGGHVAPDLINPLNSVFSSFYNELKGEAGISSKDIFACSLLGHFTDPKFKSHCFAIRSYTEMKSKDIRIMHQEAMKIYNSAKSAGVPELKAREKIAEAGMLNVDAWENTDLVFLPNNPIGLRKIFTKGSLNHNGQEYRILDNSVAALILHNLSPE